MLNKTEKPLVLKQKPDNVKLSRTKHRKRIDKHSEIGKDEEKNKHIDLRRTNTYF